MHYGTSFVVVLPFVLAPLACSSEFGQNGGGNGTTTEASDTTGNPSGTTTPSAVGTPPVNDTAPTAAGSTGGTGSGGTGVDVPTVTDGGSSSGGIPGSGVVGTAGGNSGGTSGAGIDTGSGPGSVTGSPGCGTSGRPDGGLVYVAGESWLLFPESYDGSSPMPVVFAFHACGAGNLGDANRTEFTDLTNQTAFASEYVRALPLSTDPAGCWNYNTDITRVKAFYDDLLNNYCVDVDHIFATGHSSGAQFIQQMMLVSHTADAAYFNFRGVAPVAASSYGPHGTAIPVMYIQNTNDTERGGSGQDAVEQFVAANGCSSTSVQYQALGAGCQSSGIAVDPNCIGYDDCSVATVWCSHNDPAYSGTGHGVPCFWALATDEFFKRLD